MHDYIENLDFNEIDKNTQFLINNLLYEKSKQTNQLSSFRKNQTALQINLNLKMKERGMPCPPYLRQIKQ